MLTKCHLTVQAINDNEGALKGLAEDSVQLISVLSKWAALGLHCTPELEAIVKDLDG